MSDWLAYLRALDADEAQKQLKLIPARIAQIDWSTGQQHWAGDVGPRPREAHREDLLLVVASATVLTLVRAGLIDAVIRPLILFYFPRPTKLEERQRWGEQITLVLLNFAATALTFVR